MESRKERRERLRERICPKCGRSDKEIPFYGFVCIDDYLAEKKLKVPPRILLQICKYGDKMSVSGKPKTWVSSWKEIAGQIENMIKVSGAEVKCSDVNLEMNLAVVDIIFEGDEKNKLTKEIPLDIRHTLCDVHTKSARGYYESIIQIRPPEGWKKESEGEKEEMEKRINKKTDKIIGALQAVQPDIYIKRERLKKGIDLYVSSTSSVFKALSMLGIRIVRSRKLWTMKKGKELYRTTFIVRVENVRNKGKRE